MFDAPDVGCRETVPPWTSGAWSRRNMTYGGELIELPRLRRKEKTRPLVLVCDVSGSMERYTRMLLHFIHSLSGGLDRVESFLFATRLTRTTGQLAHRGIDQAVTEVSHTVPDWRGVRGSAMP